MGGVAARLSVRRLALRRLDAAAARLLRPEDGAPGIDFAEPSGEAALFAPESVAWRVFKNPVALLVGGVAAVVLELAHPAVRTGVWEHSAFPVDPVGRMQRTGLAALVSVYGPRSRAEAMIAGVARRHARVEGRTPAGEPYRATDPRLLDWVHATATYGFTTAYARFAAPLSEDERSRAFAEALETARLFGATGAPASLPEWRRMLASVRAELEPSPIMHEMLGFVRTAPVLPWALQPLQRLMLRGAVEVVPPWVRERLGLGPRMGLRPGEAPLLRRAGALADRIVLPSGPPAQASLRLGLPANHLYRRGPSARVAAAARSAAAGSRRSLERVGPEGCTEPTLGADLRWPAPRRDRNGEPDAASLPEPVPRRRP